MFSERFQTGDMVFARHDLHSDGQVPDTQEGELLVAEGARGMVIRVGTLESQPETAIYLVRFEDAAGDLGAPLGCLTDEITHAIPA